MIFVFGSNLAGIHGAGAARYAYTEHGAVRGRGEGLYGNSYALPTKDWSIRTLSLGNVKHHVKKFLEFATRHKALEFKVTRIGCGLAGYKDKDIAPLFVEAPPNCHFDSAWKPYLPNNFNYWGTM